MGTRKFSVFLTEEDTDLILEAIRSVAEPIFVSAFANRVEMFLEDVPGDLAVGRMPAFVAISDVKYRDKIKYLRGGDYIQYNIDTSYLIDFRKPKYVGNTLHAGRFFYETSLKFGAEDKGDGFVDWAQRVFKAIKRELVRADFVPFTTYTSRSALRLRDEEGIILDPNPPMMPASKG